MHVWSLPILGPQRASPGQRHTARCNRAEATGVVEVVGGDAGALLSGKPGGGPQKLGGDKSGVGGQKKLSGA